MGRGLDQGVWGRCRLPVISRNKCIVHNERKSSGAPAMNRKAAAMPPTMIMMP